jgi:peptidoglycan/LPS O-acetylase OafA/YrhL
MPVAFRYRIAAYARSAAASDFVEPRRTEGRMDGRILAEASHRRRLMLDGLRGVAAIAVVIYHFTSHTDFWAMRGAYFAVDLFFCLSGFVLAETYRSRFAAGLSAGEFMARRLIRLYPLYLIGTMIGFAALCAKTAVGETNYSIAGLSNALQYNLLFLPYLNQGTIVNFGHPTIGQLFPTNAAAWSLFFELFVNLIFARAAGLKLKYVGMIVAASFAIYFVALLVTAAQPGWSSGNYWGGFPRALYGFFAGVGVEAILRRQAGTANRPIQSARSTLVALVILALTVAFFASPIGVTYLLGLVFAPVLVYGGAQVEVGPRFGAACVALGWLSYPLYCLHCPIYGLMESAALLFGAPLAPAPLAVVAALATLAAAVALTRWCEEPARRALSAGLAAQMRTSARAEPAAVRLNRAA